MSLARALTTRLRLDADSRPSLHLGRAASQRTAKPVRRLDISAPVALISSTNALSYNAPDIVGTSRVPDHNPTSRPLTPINDSSSSDESDASTNRSTTHTLTDNSSIGSPGSPTSPQVAPNHLSCYFEPKIDTTKAAAATTALQDVDMDLPNVPRRMASHSKRAHEHIHRKRASQRQGMMSPPPSTISETDLDRFVSRSSIISSSTEQHPFGRELRQLDEVAEGYVSVARDEDRAEALYLQSRNLAHLAASDYLSEIQGLIYAQFSEESAWI